MLPRRSARLCAGALGFAAALGLFGAARSAAGQAGAWSTRGPVGGSVYCIVPDPSRPTTLFAGTNEGVFKSGDGGATWGASGAGMPVARVQTIAVDPSAPATLYAGTLTPNGVPSIGIFKSTDGAVSWTAINNGLIDPITEISPLDVTALAVDPSHPATLLAGTRFSEIFKSTDGGATWLAQTLGGFDVNLQTSAFLYDASNPSTVYAAGTQGLLRSTDGGESWPGYGNATAPFFALVADPTNPATLYAGDAAGSGIWKSTDRGAHWNRINNSLPTNQGNLPDVVALAVDPTSPSTLYAGSFGSGLFQSTNGGSSWAAVGTGMRSSFVYALAITPGPGSKIYAGTVGGGVYQSVDGTVWTPANTGLSISLVTALVLDSAAPGTVYAAAFDGVHKSTDFGGTWQAADSGLPIDPVAALVRAPGSPQTILAGTLGGGFFKSSDGGANWSASVTGLTDSYISSIAVDPATPSTLYAGTAHPYDGSHSERVFTSTDGGATWSQTSLDAQGFALDFIAVNPANASQVVAGSQGVVGFFQSLDSGKTWSTVATDTNCGGINALLFNPSGSTLYLAGTSGFCRSQDAGKTWLVSPVGQNLSVVSLAIDPRDATTLYAGAALDFVSGASGVFRSTDGGQTWEPRGSGFPSVTVNALAVASDALGTKLYAGTSGGGVAELFLEPGRLPVRPPSFSGHRTGLIVPR